VAIFESGTVYRALAETAAQDAPRAKRHGADEHHALGALLSGALAPRSWLGEPAQADFFAAKALLAGLLDSLHVHWSVKEAQWPFLHPGRSAAVIARVAEGADGDHAEHKPLTLGFVGELHPLVAGAWGIERTTAAFAVDLGKLALVAPEVVSFAAFGSFPVLRQDLAVTLPENVPARDVLHGVRRAGGEELDGAEIFDVYTGSQVGEGRRSLALALSFRSAERTLTDEDVAPARERIVAALAELGGELRG
jgi:phenylalanyl-tRNA synthetase beta chain